MSKSAADEVFLQLFNAMRQHPGVILFTALQWIPGTSSLRRIFTSHAHDYPVGAEKTVEISAGWLDTVIARKKPFLAADLDGLKEVFADASLIQSLGCGAVINLPVLNGPTLVGVLALLDAEGRYTEQSVAAAVEVVRQHSAEIAKAFSAYPSEIPRKDPVTQ